VLRALGEPLPAVELERVAVDRAVQRGVLAAMRDLARVGGHGAHRLPLTDLTVAVAAQQSGLDVVHFDRLAGRLGIRARWVARRPDRREGVVSAADR
jgi:hypothetical protein